MTDPYKKVSQKAKADQRFPDETRFEESHFPATEGRRYLPRSEKIYAFLSRRRIPINTRPVPKSAIEAGSGTSAT